MNTRNRLTTDQKMAAIAMIARGDTASQVVAHLLTDYDIKISESTVAYIRKAHAETITKMRDTIADGKLADAQSVLERGRRMINRQLDRAERDANELDEIDREYRETNKKGLTPEEYRRRKAGLMKVSVMELVSITKAMHAQAAKSGLDLSPVSGDGKAALPSGTHQTPAQLEALLQAIQTGNMVEITQLVFNRGGQVNEPTPDAVRV